MIDSGTNSFCIDKKWGPSIPSSSAWTVWTVIFFPEVSATFSHKTQNPLICESNASALIQKSNNIEFARNGCEKSGHILLLSTLICSTYWNIDNLIPFFQKSVHICCSYREELPPLTGYGFGAKQLRLVNCEVVLCRFIWAREIKYWHNNCEK